MSDVLTAEIDAVLAIVGEWYEDGSELFAGNGQKLADFILKEDAIAVEKVISLLEQLLASHKAQADEIQRLRADLSVLSLSQEQRDSLLERWDQTESAVQREIVLHFAALLNNLEIEQTRRPVFGATAAEQQRLCAAFVPLRSQGKMPVRRMSVLRRGAIHMTELLQVVGVWFAGFWLWAICCELVAIKGHLRGIRDRKTTQEQST